MKKEILLVGILLILILPVLAEARNEKIDSSVFNKEDGQKIRVVVKYKENNIKNKFSILSFVDYTIPKKNINYETQNTVFASLTRKEIEYLAESDLVEYISEEKMYQAFLQDSVPLINATSSWNLQSMGINLTGEGQTICIIDTGINYSHPDLGGCFGNNNISSECKVIGGWDYCADNINCMTEDSDPMDVDGHGAHVSGIASAYGKINGTAPFSKIIMIKAGNATGSFWESGIKKSIDWCTNNASKFNISVISMSLGGGLYNNYCDEYSDGDRTNEHDTIDLVSSINNAVAKNISVVVASGNGGSTTKIASPACIQNATPVTSSTKADNNISSFANRWNSSLLKILAAPGETINSTKISGDYITESGTSMSTPHVAGVIAILNQYLKSINKTKTPSEVEDILDTTGKKIYDEDAKRNFSRIDVYSALMYLDETTPFVKLFSPENNSVNLTQNQTFIFNASDWQLKNATLYIWHKNGTISNNSESVNIGGVENSSDIEILEIAYGDYLWNYYVCDENSNCAFSEYNSSLLIGGVRLSMLPGNNTYTNVNETYFNCSATSHQDYSLKNVSFFLWNSSNEIINGTVNITGIQNYSKFNYTLIEEGNYSWGCIVYNNNSDFNSENYSITYDITFPNITLNEIVSASSIFIEISSDEEINYSVTLQNTVNSNFSLNHSIIINGLISSNNYEYNLTYCDRAGNCNSTMRVFRTNDIPPPVRSSGGGGGSSSSIVVQESQLNNGYSKIYSTGTKTEFKIENKTHTLNLNKITNNKTNITIKSDPINFELGEKEEKKTNLSNGEYYDILVRVESITKYSANITLTKINETINPFKLIKYENMTNETKSNEKIYETFEDPKDESKPYVAISLAIGFIIIISYLWLLLVRNALKKQKQLLKKQKR